MFPLYSRCALACRVGAAVLLSLWLIACSQDDEPSPPAPTTVTLTQPNFYPESVQYDALRKTFLVTSLTTGQVRFLMDNDTQGIPYDQPELVSTTGLHLDEAHDRVLVAVADLGTNLQRTSPATLNNLARLVIFRPNLSGPSNSSVVVELSGLRPKYATHLANDIAVDAQGNVYVTDSFAPLIYKVDAQSNVATVFLEAPQLAAPAGQFGLNGIVFHPDGYLLVAKSDEGVLLKVPLNNPAGFTRVGVSQDLRGADGMLLQDSNTLQVVSNTQAKVFRLTTTNSFTSATLSGTFLTGPQFPTALAQREGASYVLYANLDKLFAGQNPPVSQFSINRVNFQ